MAASSMSKQLLSILLKEQSFWYGIAVQEKQIENDSIDKCPYTYGMYFFCYGL